MAGVMWVVLQMLSRPLRALGSGALWRQWGLSVRAVADAVRAAIRVAAFLRRLAVRLAADAADADRHDAALAYVPAERIVERLQARQRGDLVWAFNWRRYLLRHLRPTLA
jgi:hypothetical protein